MTRATLDAPVAYFHRISPSRLVNRYTGDMNAVDFVSSLTHSCMSGTHISQTFPISLLDFAFSSTFVRALYRLGPSHGV